MNTDTAPIMIENAEEDSDAKAQTDVVDLDE